MGWKLNDSTPIDLAQDASTVPAARSWKLNDSSPTALTETFQLVPAAWAKLYWGGPASMDFPAAAGTTPISASDSGTLTDGVLSLTLGGPNDVGSLTDGVLSIVLSGIAETGTAADISTTITLGTPADTSTTTDDATYSAMLSDADAATLADALAQIGISGPSDTATLSDSAAYSATVADIELVTGTDLATLIALYGLDESALISEFADVVETNMINVMDADSGEITESASLLITPSFHGGFASSPRSTGDHRRHRTIITHHPASPSVFDVEPKVTLQVMQPNGLFDDDDDKAITSIMSIAA